MTLIPPSPVSDRIEVEIRAGVVNRGETEQVFDVSLFVRRAGDETSGGAAGDDRPADLTGDGGLVARETVWLGPGETALAAARWPTTGRLGWHEAIASVHRKGERAGMDQIPVSTGAAGKEAPGERDEAQAIGESAGAGGEIARARRRFVVVPSRHRSTDTVDGAFGGFTHWSEEEGRLWNEEIRKMTREDWRELVGAMHEAGMDIFVPQESFRNQEYVEKHAIEREGYRGRAYYPSRLVPERMETACDDPLGAVLDAADGLGMSVFLPVGMYAWFDFTPGSLAWHKRAATELWERYGHHPSAYGWYVSEEVHGNLGASAERREEIVEFFREFRAHCRGLCPDMPVMLAPNCYDVRMSVDVYRRLLPHLDILCPFAFHRMPEGDQTGEEAAAMLQALCDNAGAHLWLDMEAFVFLPDTALAPRPVEGLIDDFRRFPNFEKVICYQFPGLFNAPWQGRKPGGPATERLYLDYKRYYEEKRKEWAAAGVG